MVLDWGLGKLEYLDDYSTTITDIIIKHNSNVDFTNATIQFENRNDLINCHEIVPKNIRDAQMVLGNYGCSPNFSATVTDINIKLYTHKTTQSGMEIK